ncbi:response regulator [Psychromonas sp. MME2]|uniref:response regulator n=1 Tax=Psychromonas sp. MME2 TaxID=3231033 RepID=UPI00339C55F2
MANNGLKALELVKQSDGEFDVILMDIHMPGMNGYQTCTQIRKQYDQQQLPIIALSAITACNVQKEILDVGFNLFIAKPFDPETLFTAILASVAKLKSDQFPLPLNKQVPATQSLFPAQLLSTDSPINIASAIKNVGGDALFLKKLLLQFYDNHGDDIVAINDAFAEHKFQEIKRIAHTLKGVAATIAAETLYQDAKNLENLAGQSASSSKVAIDKLAMSFKLVKDTLQELLDNITVHSKSCDNLAGNKIPNREKVTHTFKLLEKSLRDGAFEAKQHLSELQCLLNDDDSNIDMTPLTILLDNFEFEAAHSKLLEMLKASAIDIS